MKNDIPNSLPMVMATEREYAELAEKVGSPPFSYLLTMSNGVNVGWRSNRHVYVSPEAYKVATGKYPKGYRPLK